MTLVEWWLRVVIVENSVVGEKIPDEALLIEMNKRYVVRRGIVQIGYGRR